MSNVYRYHKGNSALTRKRIRLLGLSLLLIGVAFIAYFAFPLISWQVYFAQVFASQSVETPIPKAAALTSGSVKTLVASGVTALTGVDYTNAQNWFPGANPAAPPAVITTYTLAIPKIGIEKALVSTVDYDLKEHLVHYGGTAVPPAKGTAVVFGHSTLPQLFNQEDYKTIFAKAHELKIGDTITVTVDNISYTYNIFKISVVEPDDTSVLAQDYSDSFLTLVTCTPPGTTWKRLVIQAKVQLLSYATTQ